MFLSCQQDITCLTDSNYFQLTTITINNGSHFLTSYFFEQNLYLIIVVRFWSVNWTIPLFRKTTTFNRTTLSNGSHFSCLTFWSKMSINLVVELGWFVLTTGPCLSSPKKGSHFSWRTFLSIISIDLVVQL